MSSTNATSWIQSRLTTLYEAGEDANIRSSFDQVFSPTCEVRVDHAVQPLQMFKDELIARRAAVQNVTVAWNADVISTNDDKPDQPSVVAGSLVITRSFAFRIRAAPAQRKMHVHFSARIEQYVSVQADDQGDRRRITSFYYTSVDRTPPIHFAIPHATQEALCRLEENRSYYVMRVQNIRLLEIAILELVRMASIVPGFDSRRHIGVFPERATHVSTTDYPGHYPGEDNSWNFSKFQEKLTVRVERLSNRSIDFDLIGVDPSIANAFRRILIAEVPTVCIERVYVWVNTSVIVDEVLAHRLGLIPLSVDPAFLEVKDPQNDQATDRNTLVFRLKGTCERLKNAPKDATDPKVLYINSEVLSSQLEWVPQGEQEVVMAANPPAPTNPNIVLAKLRPGQEIETELHAVKGVGKDHAKFCPVATASYRYLPKIILNPQKPVPPELAEKFQKCFTPGVIRVNPRTREVSVDEEKARFESMSREVYRHPEFDGCVQLARVRDHFLFNIESEGFYPPERLLLESIQVMRTKIATLRRVAEALLNDTAAKEDVDMAEA